MTKKLLGSLSLSLVTGCVLVFCSALIPTEAQQLSEAEPRCCLEYEQMKQSFVIVLKADHAELTLTTPSGTRVGYEPTTNLYISPNKSAMYVYGPSVFNYWEVKDGNHEKRDKVIILSQPEQGEYTLTVSGIVSDSYSMAIFPNGKDRPSLSSAENSAIGKKQSHTYQFRVDYDEKHKIFIISKKEMAFPAEKITTTDSRDDDEHWFERVIIWYSVIPCCFSEEALNNVFTIRLEPLDAASIPELYATTPKELPLGANLDPPIQYIPADKNLGGYALGPRPARPLTSTEWDFSRYLVLLRHFSTETGGDFIQHPLRPLMGNRTYRMDDGKYKISVASLRKGRYRLSFCPLGMNHKKQCVVFGKRDGVTILENERHIYEFLGESTPIISTNMNANQKVDFTVNRQK